MSSKKAAKKRKKEKQGMPMGGEQMEMSLQQFGPMVESAFANLGPSIHVISAQGEQGVRRRADGDRA